MRRPFLPLPDYLPDEVRAAFETMNKQAAAIMRTVDQSIDYRAASDDALAHRARTLANLQAAIGAARAAIECKRQSTDASTEHAS